MHICGDKIDGTHEGKIPNRLLLGECPVLLRGMYLIVAHLHVSSRTDYPLRNEICACTYYYELAWSVIRSQKSVK